MRQKFNRTDGLFSLCGLNCGLCPMQIRGDCSGCFNDYSALKKDSFSCCRKRSAIGVKA